MAMTNIQAKALINREPVPFYCDDWTKQQCLAHQRFWIYAHWRYRAWLVRYLKWFTLQTEG